MPWRAMSLDPAVFDNWFTTLHCAAQASRWRFLVVLAGEEAWAQGLCSGLTVLEHASWLGAGAPEGFAPIESGDASRLLGTEINNLVINAWQGLAPNALGILSGTVKAGGCLVLLTPPLEVWGDHADADYQRIAVQGCAAPDHKRMLAHFAAVARQQAVVVEQGSTVLPQIPAVTENTAALASQDGCLSDDQLAAVEAIEKVATGHRNRPAVITADRGRGKTAALGIAAARLLQGDLDEILVTAPLLAAVAPLFERAQALLPGAEWHGARLHWQGKIIQFMPPDELLRLSRPSRLLLVDEAAAIPAPVLGRMLDHYHRIVFTTTVHGYEGTGRGFAVRFQQELSARMPHWKYLVMNTPIRWAQDDPLEKAIRAMLFLEPEAAADHDLTDVALTSVSIEPINRDELIARPGLLDQLVGLLTLAHYRTTPEDIRVLLDGPNIRLVVATVNEQVVGAAMIAEEGSFSGELAGAIEQGERRPRGHVLPQALMAQTGCASLLRERSWRIVRIAVHPVLKRQGLGKRILQACEQYATKEKLDYLGSSFAATPDLLPFWVNAGFQVVSLGSRRDSVSGACAALVLKGLSEPARTLVPQEAEHFHSQLLAGLAEHWQVLEAEVVAQLLSSATYKSGSRELADARAFVDGHRSFEHCLPGVYAAALQLLGRPEQVTPVEANVQVLIAKVLQKRSFAEVASAFKLSGRAEVLRVLQKSLLEVVE